MSCVYQFHFPGLETLRQISTSCALLLGAGKHWEIKPREERFSSLDVRIKWVGDGTVRNNENFSLSYNFKGFLKKLFVLLNLRQSVLFPRNRWLTRWLILSRGDYTEMYVRAKIKQTLSQVTAILYYPFLKLNVSCYYFFSNLEGHDSECFMVHCYLWF